MLTSHASTTRSLRRLVCSATAVALSLVVHHALADEASAEVVPAEEHAAPPDRHDDILVTGGAGVMGEATKVGGTLSLTGLRQKGMLGYGATFESSGVILDYTSETAAPLLGIFVDGPRSLRAGLAAAAGIHSYHGVDKGFIFSNDPGGSGVTGFVGARAFLGAEFGGAVRFHVGLQLSADDDLTRTRKAYTYPAPVHFGGEPAGSETTEHTVGALRFGVLVAMGVAFDL